MALVQVGKQELRKKGGKWNKYSHRVRRNVIFFGIERVVPHSEKSVSRSYRKVFTETDRQGWEGSVRKVVSRILGNDYDHFGIRNMASITSYGEDAWNYLFRIQYGSRRKCSF